MGRVPLPPVAQLPPVEQPRLRLAVSHRLLAELEHQVQSPAIPHVYAD